MQSEIITHQFRSRAAKEKYWRTHLAAQGRSGLTQVEYCRRNRLSKSTLGWWKQKLHKSGSPPWTLIPVSVVTAKNSAPFKSGPQTSSGLTLIARSGDLIEISVDFHPPTLERVLRTLEKM